MFSTALKIATKLCIPILEIEHDQGKCTLFYCCFDHYRMLTYKISACEVCMIWRKPTEALKKPSPIAESRTGKPAIITLKIQLDCSTVHDTSLWANVYVRSHLGCGRDSVFICFCKSHKYFKDAKAMQINRILKISLIWHVKLNQSQNNRDLHQGILHLWSKFGGSSVNGWWVTVRTSSQWGKFWLWSQI